MESKGYSAKAPLLPKKGLDHEDDEMNMSFPSALSAEIKVICYIAGPAILTSLFQYSLAFVTRTLVGHIGTIELAAFSIQSLVIAGIGFGVMLGMGSALQTLCGQAYGDGKLNMMGVYMQRSWVILTCTTFPLSLLYIFTTPILRALGQSEEIAVMAGKFSIWMIPQLLAYTFNFPIQKFLQAQSKVMAMAWISLGSLVFHLLLSWVCIMKLEMGLIGAALTLDFSWLVMVLAQLLYILWGCCGEAWSGFSWLAFADLASFLGLSCASAIMICLEYWCMMVVIMLAGLLKNPEIAVDAASICMNVEGWIFMIPLGFTAAASVRVSNELGAGKPRAAKFSVWVMVAMSVIIQTIFVLLIFITRDSFPALFTDDKLVMAKVTKIALFLCISIFLSSVQPVLSGVAIGAGWQAIVAYVNIGCYYLVGFTSGAILEKLIPFNIEFLNNYILDGFGTKGLWGGLLAGIALQNFILIVITLRTDWEKEAKLAKHRVSMWESLDHDLPKEVDFK